ncbi:MAG TPA: hypothetical protein VHX44_14710 [Planctomycetota bacterium]|nr:hypothetical protein [Planctomycetota bacterium]
MDHDRLLDLLDHPAPDADAPRNPVLAHQVMERVRQAHATANANANATARATSTDSRPWILGAVLVALIAIIAPFTGMIGADGIGGGGLGEAANLFDSEQVLELLVGAVIAAAVLALSWRRLA